MVSKVTPWLRWPKKTQRNVFWNCNSFFTGLTNLTCPNPNNHFVKFTDGTGNLVDSSHLDGRWIEDEHQPLQRRYDQRKKQNQTDAQSLQTGTGFCGWQGLTGFFHLAVDWWSSCVHPCPFSGRVSVFGEPAQTAAVPLQSLENPTEPGGDESVLPEKLSRAQLRSRREENLAGRAVP